MVFFRAQTTSSRKAPRRFFLREFYNLLLFLNDELEDSVLYDKSLIPSHPLSSKDYYDGGDWCPAPSFLLTVKRMKADDVPLASLSDEHVYVHLQSAQAAHKTPGHTPSASTSPLTNLDIVGAIWSIDDSHQGHIELELLLEYGIWCPDGLSVDEFWQAIGWGPRLHCLDTAPCAPAPRRAEGGRRCVHADMSPLITRSP